MIIFIISAVTCVRANQKIFGCLHTRNVEHYNINDDIVNTVPAKH